MEELMGSAIKLLLAAVREVARGGEVDGARWAALKLGAVIGKMGSAFFESGAVEEVGFEEAWGEFWGLVTSGGVKGGGKLGGKYALELEEIAYMIWHLGGAEMLEAEEAPAVEVGEEPAEEEPEEEGLEGEEPIEGEGAGEGDEISPGAGGEGGEGGGVVESLPMPGTR